MSARRNRWVYLLLAVGAILICVWQGFEHCRARETARSALLNRAIDITNTLGVVLRSQGFFGLVRQARLEAALRELTKSGELESVAVLYASGNVAASAGVPMELDTESLLTTGVRWGEDTLTVVNPVDLGADPQDGNTPRASIVIPEGEDIEPHRPPPPPRPRDGEGTDDSPGDERPRRRWRDSSGPRSFGRPFWLNEQEYTELVNKQGVHYFVLSLSTSGYRTAVGRDLRLRALMVGISLVAVAGLALAWRNAEHSASLQMDLLRADEMNRHLKEMNLAAAGLAHETRNPLNIIRGLAQMMSKRDDAQADVRGTACRIADEVDRVTERLNQFIAYSRPPEVKPAPTDLKAVVADVARTLETDREDKGIRFDLTGPDMTVYADESLLRQVVFNLLLNAIQALPHGGAVSVTLSKEWSNGAMMEVRDNGPGVPESSREDIFRPYFTTSKQGTGLGLAVVRHIVLAHGWDIAYMPNDGGGAVFRITGLQTV